MTDRKKIAVAILTLIVALTLYPWVIMLCWNAVVPAVLGLPVVTYGQSFLLYVLARIFFHNTNYKAFND